MAVKFCVRCGSELKTVEEMDEGFCENCEVTE